MMPTRVNAPCFFFVSFLLIQSFSTFVLLEIYVSEVCSVPTTGYKNISLVSLVRGYSSRDSFFFSFFFFPKGISNLSSGTISFLIVVRSRNRNRTETVGEKRERKDELAISITKRENEGREREEGKG